MTLDKINVGRNVPDEVNVIIEISMNADPVKYEFNKEAGVLEVDRFTVMRYPCNYGFIPHTLSGDGDPVDVLVCASYAIQPGAMISVRPIGVLITEDEKGADEKILAVPGYKVDPYFDKVEAYKDLPEIFLQKIEHFFENYKKLEKGKWVKTRGWQDAAAAKKIINDAVKRHG